jgi:nicotinate-nucleotide adenylyltransferase
VEQGKYVNDPSRIGVFGGTFDPIHTGHLAIARAALEQACLDKVLFVIAANPPHKHDNAITAAPLRVAMTASAIADNPEFEICSIELERPGPSYTADTLKRLHEMYAPAELFFIAGYDSAIDLPRWRSPEKILQLARLLVAPRPQNTAPLPKLVRDHCSVLQMEDYPVSSSEIRTRMEHGEDMAAWLPVPTVAFIREKGLYRAGC